MSARHRKHKQKLAAAELALAERVGDLLAYDRVIADMAQRPLAPSLGAAVRTLVSSCRDAVERDRARLRKVIEDLERTLPP